jgi:two-component system, cell cycle response regulator DivK
MKQKILIIEDNLQNMYLATFILEQHGFIVVQAINGRSGIKMALKEKPDLILLDIQLPEMDGYTVARKLRKHAKLSHIPIVAVTSYAMPGDKDRVLAAGCVGYVEKPIDPDTFIHDVTQHMTNSLD